MFSVLKLRRYVYQKANMMCLVRYCSEFNDVKKEPPMGSNKLENLMNHLYNFQKPKTAIITIESLASLTKSESLTYEDLKRNEHFEVLIDLLRTATMETPINVMATLTNLDVLQFPNTCDSVKNLELSLLKYEMSMTGLMHLFKFFQHREPTETQTRITKEIIQGIEGKVSNTPSMPEAIFIYKNSSHFSESLLLSLDEMVLGKSNTLDNNTLVSIVISQSESNRRIPQLLHTLSKSLFKNPSSMSPKQMTNAFYAFSHLNYLDKELVNKLANNFVDSIEDINVPTTIGAMLFCLGQSRYRHENLLNAISAWIEGNSDICRSRDICLYLKTLATVNYVPDNFDNIMKLFLHRLRQESEENPTMWISCVWALVVLKKAEKDVVESVLRQSVYVSLSKPDQYLITTFLKLLNINAAAKLIKECETLALPQDTVTEMILRMKLYKQIQSTKGIQILNNFLTVGKVNANVLTAVGITIGAEFILDANKKPQLLENYKTSFAVNPSPLPKEMHRIAAMFWSFKHYCFDSELLTGDSLLAKELLSTNGYTVLEVPVYELDKGKTAVNHVTIVNEKIKELY